MKPTNKELNILCASIMHIFCSDGAGPQTTNYIRTRDCPDYCSDRNALNDVYDWLNDSDNCTMECYERFMENIIGTQFSSNKDTTAAASHCLHQSNW